MIIGLTGTIGSGKETVSKILQENGFKQVVFSDVIREELYLRGIDATRKNLQKMANELREEYGDNILAKRVLEKTNLHENFVVDGIRNPGEYEELCNGNDFFLVAIDAPQAIRYARIKKRGREGDPKTFKDFKKCDDFETKSRLKHGQRITDTMKFAKYVIINDGNISILSEKVTNLLADLKKTMPSGSRPSWDEYFINIAEMVGTRGTCDRGRSGCVIVKDKRIVSTGYVGSPAGTAHCDEVGHEMHTVVHQDESQTRHCIRTSHAEQNALVQAARFGVSVDGAALYCHMTPCYVCAKMIINAGIKRVICNKDYHDSRRSKEIFLEAGIDLKIISGEVQAYKDM